MFEKKLDYYDYESFIKVKNLLNVEFLDKFYNEETNFLENDNFYNNYFIGLYHLKYSKNINNKLAKLYIKYFYENKDSSIELLEEIYLSKFTNDKIKKGLYLHKSNHSIKYYHLYLLYKNIDSKKSEKYLNKGVDLNNVYCLYVKTNMDNVSSKYILYIKILDILKDFYHTKLYKVINIDFYIYRLKTNHFGLCNTISTLKNLAKKHRSGRIYFELFIFNKDLGEKNKKLFIDECGFHKFENKTHNSVLFQKFSEDSINYLLKSQDCGDYNIYKEIIKYFKNDKIINYILKLNAIRFPHLISDEKYLLNIGPRSSSGITNYNGEKFLNIFLRYFKYIEPDDIINSHCFNNLDIVKGVTSYLGQKRKREN